MDSAELREKGELVAEVRDFLSDAFDRFLQLRVGVADRRNFGLQRILNEVFPIHSGRLGGGILTCRGYRLGRWRCPCGRLAAENWRAAACEACGGPAELDLPSDVVLRRMAGARLLRCSLELRHGGRDQVAYMAPIPLMRGGRFLYGGYEVAAPLRWRGRPEAYRVERPDESLEQVIRRHLGKWSVRQRAYMRAGGMRRAEQPRIGMTGAMYAWLRRMGESEDSNPMALYVAARTVSRVFRRANAGPRKGMLRRYGRAEVALDGRAVVDFPVGAICPLRRDRMYEPDVLTLAAGVESDGSLSTPYRTADGGVGRATVPDLRRGRGGLRRYRPVGDDQFFGPAAALVPARGHDAPERIAEWSADLARAVPLLAPEPPRVRTGWEAILWDRACSAVADDDWRGSPPGMGYVCTRQGTVERRGYGRGHGSLPVGRNLLTALMPWRGHGYEGGVILSSAVVESGVLRSAHAYRQIAAVNDLPSGPEVCWRVDDRLDFRGLLPVGGEVRVGDVLLGKLRPIHGKPRSLREVSRVAGRGGGWEGEYREASVRAEHAGRLVWRDVLYSDLWAATVPAEAVRDKGVSTKVAFYIQSVRNVEVGDELTDRHGNRTVVAAVAPEADMPILPDGRPVEAIFNPIVVLERESFGMAKEMAAAGGTALTLRDGATGEEFDSPVLAGHVWWAKLNQWGASGAKAPRARSVGAYQYVTQQPVDGERWTEELAWGLIGKGAANTLLEMTTLKSDDVSGRNRLYAGIGMGEPPPRLRGLAPETVRVLGKEIQALGLDLRFLVARRRKDG